MLTKQLLLIEFFFSFPEILNLFLELHLEAYILWFLDAPEDVGPFLVDYVLYD